MEARWKGLEALEALEAPGGPWRPLEALGGSGGPWKAPGKRRKGTELTENPPLRPGFRVIYSIATTANGLGGAALDGRSALASRGSFAIDGSGPATRRETRRCGTATRSTTEAFRV